MSICGVKGELTNLIFQAMALHMMTNNLFSLIQNQVFGMERVRKLCGIPDAKTDSKGPVDKRNVKAIIKCKH